VSEAVDRRFNSVVTQTEKQLFGRNDSSRGSNITCEAAAAAAGVPATAAAGAWQQEVHAVRHQLLVLAPTSSSLILGTAAVTFTSYNSLASFCLWAAGSSLIQLNLFTPFPCLLSVLFLCWHMQAAA
jgi:hypothetical protein